MVQKAKGFAGSEKYLLKIIPKLKENGIEAELLIIYETQYHKEIEDFIQPVKAAQITYYRIETKSNLSFGLLKKINQVVKGKQYDLVHSHLPHADLWCGLIKLFFQRNMKLVSTKHSYDEAYANEVGLINIKKRYDRFFWVSWVAEKMINRSFCVSQALKKLFVELGICKAERVDVIYHGIVPKGETTFQANKKGAKFQLIMVGRLIDLKGHRFLLQIMPQLIDRYGDKIEVHIVGDGPIKAKLKQMAVDLKVEEYVHFWGFQQDVFERISNAHISLCLSTAEGFGLVILESFDAQTPVIAFDVPACNEIIEHQKNGVLVPPYDTEVLYNEIVELLKDSNKALDLSKQAHIDLRKRFSYELMVEETIQFYRKVLSA